MAADDADAIFGDRFTQPTARVIAAFAAVATRTRRPPTGRRVRPRKRSADFTPSLAAAPPQGRMAGRVVWGCGGDGVGVGGIFILAVFVVGRAANAIARAHAAERLGARVPGHMGLAIVSGPWCRRARPDPRRGKTRPCCFSVT